MLRRIIKVLSVRGDVPALVLDKANVSKLNVAADTLETSGMPTLTHGSNDATNHKLSWRDTQGWREDRRGV